MQIGIIRKNGGLFVGAVSTLDPGTMSSPQPSAIAKPEAPPMKLWMAQGVDGQRRNSALFGKDLSGRQRHGFLQGQLNDVLQSRCALHATISGEEKGNMSVVWDDGNRRNRQTSETKEAAADGTPSLGNPPLATTSTASTLSKSKG
jgi:hypothetical protein